MSNTATETNTVTLIETLTQGAFVPNVGKVETHILNVIEHATPCGDVIAITYTNQLTDAWIHAARDKASKNVWAAAPGASIDMRFSPELEELLDHDSAKAADHISNRITVIETISYGKHNIPCEPDKEQCDLITVLHESTCGRYRSLYTVGEISCGEIARNRNRSAGDILKAEGVDPETQIDFISPTSKAAPRDVAGPLQLIAATPGASEVIETA